MSAEPNLTNADLAKRIDHGFKQDERLRSVENTQAAFSATISGVQGELATMRRQNATDKAEMREQNAKDKAELLNAIRESKPNPWPIVITFIAFATLLLGVGAAIYTGG